MNGKPTVSSTFPALANVSEVVYDVGRAQSASGGAVTGASLAYDADTDSFALSDGTNRIIFAPGDLTIGASNFLRYESVEGSTTTRLELDWGMRSEWTSTPESVALGQLVSKQSDIPTGIDHYRSVDFVFGMPSEASAVPTSGSAAYALSLSGTRSSAATNYLLEMSGAGTALIDFTSGDLEIFGRTGGYTFWETGSYRSESQGDVHASGAIVAGKNLFSGTFTAQVGASDTYSGNFSGSFYGPAAKDIGGTLYGTSGPLFYSLAFAGYGLPDTAPEDTLDNLTGSTRFRTVHAFFVLPAAERLQEPLKQGVIYDAETQTYTVSSSAAFGFSFGPANRTVTQDAGDLRAYGVADPTVDGKVQYSIGLFDGNAEGIELTYASFMRVASTLTDFDGRVMAEGVDYIGFGNFTPPDQLPKTGSATYAGRLFGDLHDDTKVLASLTGQSNLTADFAAGTLAASLFPVQIDAGGTSTALGQYDFSGSINAFSAAFMGSWNSGTGYLVGRFYGNEAQEYAAVFNIDDPVVGKMTGISIGKRNEP